MATYLESKWDGLSPHLLATFFDVERTSATEFQPVADGVRVRAPFTGSVQVSMDPKWDSPFDSAGAESRAPTLMAMLQSGQMQAIADAGQRVGVVSGDTAQKSNQFLMQFAGRTGMTKLNSTQIFVGSDPMRIQGGLIFRAWNDALEEVENPVDWLAQRALPVQLSKDGSLVARGTLAAGGELDAVSALMPSLAPSMIGMIYKGRCFYPLVIEQFAPDFGAPVNADGHFTHMQVQITLTSLAAIDREDWTNFRTLPF